MLDGASATSALAKVCKRPPITGQRKRTAVASDDVGRHLRYCHRTLIEIDHYGERLVGCIECNRWGRPGDDTVEPALTAILLVGVRIMRILNKQTLSADALQGKCSTKLTGQRGDHGMGQAP